MAASAPRRSRRCCSTRGRARALTKSRLHVQRLDREKRTVVVQAGASGRYVASGHVIYARNDELFAVPFDVDALACVRAGQPSERHGVERQRRQPIRGVRQRRLRVRGWKREPVRAAAGVGAAAMAASSRWRHRHAEYHGNAVISPDGRRAAVDMEGGRSACGSTTSCAPR